jgi:uncharacterized protein YjiS (DUF1127 family)
MREATRLKSPPPPDHIAVHRATAVRDAAVVVLRRRVTVNHMGDNPASDSDEIESRAQYARAANGLGDVDALAATHAARRARYELQQAARTRRWLTLGEMIVAAIRAGGALARRAYARYRQRRQASAFYDALRRLDDHTLRDLGFDRSEIRSVVAEVTGEAEHTRLRVTLAPSDLQW